MHSVQLRDPGVDRRPLVQGTSGSSRRSGTAPPPCRRAHRVSRWSSCAACECVTSCAISTCNDAQASLLLLLHVRSHDEVARQDGNARTSAIVRDRPVPTIRPPVPRHRDARNENKNLNKNSHQRFKHVSWLKWSTRRRISLHPSTCSAAAPAGVQVAAPSQPSPGEGVPSNMGGE